MGSWKALLSLCLLVLSTISFARHQFQAEVIQGASASFAATAEHQPASGLSWAVYASSTDVGDSSTPNGWTVSYNTATATFTLGSPSTATIAQSYDVRWAVTASLGASAYFDVVAPGTPPPPVNLSATSGNGVVNLSWTVSAGATSYNVLRTTTNRTNYHSIAFGFNALTYSDTTASNGTTYYYVVQARNSYGTSVYSNEVSSTPLGPNGILNAFGGQNLVALSWSASPGVTTYTLSSSSSPTGPFTQIYTGGSSTLYYTDYTVANGATMYYELVGTGSTDGPYNEASATPSGSAQTDYYAPSYSGGTSSDGQAWGQAEEGYSGGVSIQDGFGPGLTACVSGTVTTTLTWVGPDPSPLSVQVDRHVSAFAFSDWSSQASNGDALLVDDGFGDAEFINSGGQSQSEGVVDVDHPLFFANPGGVINLPAINPTVSVLGEDTGIEVDGELVGESVTVQWSTYTTTTVYNATISVAGTTNSVVAVGQQLTASLTLTGLTASAADTYTWTLLGSCAPIYNYRVPTNAASVTALTDAVPPPGTGSYMQQPQLLCYMTQGSIDGSTTESIGCKYHNAALNADYVLSSVSVPVVAPRFSQDTTDVSGTASVTLINESVQNGYRVATPSSTNPNKLMMYGMNNSLTAFTYGISLAGEVSDPTQIVGQQAGSWSYVQTIQNFEGVVYSPPPPSGSSVIQLGPYSTLDGSPPGDLAGRKIPFITTWPAGSGIHSLADDPSVGGLPGNTLPATPQAYSLQGLFHTYIYYTPPPSSTNFNTISLPVAQFDWATCLAGQNTNGQPVVAISPASPGSPWTFQSSPGTTVPTAVAPITPALPLWNAPIAPPPAPTVTPLTNKIQLNWAQVPNAVTYVVKVLDTTSGKYVPVWSGTSTTYTYTAASGTQVTFVLDAANINGASADSPPAAGTSK